MRSASAIVSLALLAALPACDFKFDGQTIRLVADQEHDRLDVLLVYHGLWVDKAEPKAQLELFDRLLAARMVMLVDAWPLAFSVQHPGTELDAVAERVQVTQGPLFVDESGQLSMYQMLRVRDVKGLLALANDAIRTELLACLEQGRKVFDQPADQETETLLRAAIGERHAFVEKRGTALVLIVPCSDAFHTRFRRELLRSLVEEVVDSVLKEPRRATADEVLQRPLVRMVLDNEWSISRVGNRTHVTLGIPGAARGTLVKPRFGKYEPTLLEALAKAGRAVVDKLSVEEIDSRFAAFVRNESRPAGGAGSRPAR